MRIARESGAGIRSSWLRTASAMVIAGLVAVGLAAGASIAVKRPTVKLTGIVSDSICGMDHGIKAVGDPACTRACVALGADYALMVGRKMYILEGHRDDLDRYAGSEVSIEGRAVGRNTVIVEQVGVWYADGAEGRK